MANRAAGKGYENENFYSNIKFQFVGIENIHVMRSSLQKVVEGWHHISQAMIVMFNHFVHFHQCAS
jgi:myotubularin-related protein 6/7/8